MIDTSLSFPHSFLPQEILDGLQKKEQKHLLASQSIQNEHQAVEAFWKGNTKALVGYMKRGSEGRIFERPVFGPIQLSVYTKQAQEMFENIFSDFQGAAVLQDKASIILKIKDKAYDLSQILPFAQFDLISLSKEALDVYRKLLQSNEILYKPQFKKIPDWRQLSEEDFKNYFSARGYLEPDDPESQLSLAEKCALNIFTGESFRVINPVMRTQFEKAIAQNTLLSPLLSEEKKLAITVKEALVHIAVISSALNKLPEYIPPDGEECLWRCEYNSPRFFLHMRTKAIEEGGSVEHLAGFFSCSHTCPEEIYEKGEFTSGVVINCSKRAGKNISFFSQRPHEREILYASPIIQWKYARGDLFIGKMLSSPQEYPTICDFDRMADYFSTLDPSAMHREFERLYLETRADFCAFLLQRKIALPSVLDAFFQSPFLLASFTSVDSKTQAILLAFAQEQNIPFAKELLRFHAQTLASTIQASQMIQDKMLSNSTFLEIMGLRGFFKSLAQTNPDALRRYYEHPDFQERIKDLKKECVQRFTKESLEFAGQDSLNRELLTGTKWNQALSDPRVILGLFALEADPNGGALNEQVNCLSYAKGRTITSMIAEGVKAHHPVVLETLPLNSAATRSSLQTYIERKDIHHTFVPIFQAIERAYTMVIDAPLPPAPKSLFDVPYSSSGWKGYCRIFDALLQAIHTQDEATLFASEAKTPPEQLKAQVLAGFYYFCKRENIDPTKTTSQELIERMVGSDQLLDATVSHLMCDRLHFLVALRSSDLRVELKDGKISFAELFRRVMQFLAHASKLSLQHALAAEQFYSQLLFLAEKLGISLPSASVEESSSQVNFRASSIEQQRTQELRRSLLALSSHSEIRALLEQEFDFQLPEVETLEVAELQTLKLELKTLFRTCYEKIGEATPLYISCFEDVLNSPEYVLQFLRWVRTFHLDVFHFFINRSFCCSPRTMEEYESSAKEVEEVLNNPEKGGSIKEIFILSQMMNRYVLKHLKQLPSLEKIHLRFTSIDLTDPFIQKAFQTLEQLGLYPKIETLLLDIFWKGDLLNEIVKMKNLRTVTLTQFPFSRVPQEIQSLQSLQILKIVSRALTEFSVGPGGLPNLTELYINCDKLISISEDLSSLSLQKLTVMSSQIKELPQAIWHMKSLKELCLSCDSLTSIPEDLSLPHLQKLTVTSSRIKELPQAIWHMKSLKELCLSCDSLTSIPEDLSLPNLQKLTIHSSNLSHYPAALVHMERPVEAYLNCPLVASEDIDLLTKKFQDFKICKS